MAGISRSKFVYAGVTRWAGGGSGAVKPDTLGGVFRLKLGEQDWEHMMTGFPEIVHVQCLLVHPEAPEICFAGTHDGVYRSRDNARSWQRMELEPRDTQIWSLTVSPQNSNVMFAGASPAGIYRSTDSGETWEEIKAGAIPNRLDTEPFKTRVMRIAIDPANALFMGAALEVNGAIASEDGGASWADRSHSLLELACEPRLKSQILTTSDDEGVLDAHAVCICPAGSRPAFLANRMGIFKSTDQFKTWTDLRVDRYSEFTYGREVRASVSEPGIIYAGLSVASNGETGSVARSADLGESWQRFDHGIKVASTVTSIGQHPENDEIVFFSARRGQVFGTLDAGRNWQAYPLRPGCEGVYAVTCN